VAFEEFSRWLSPWGYLREEIEAALGAEAARGTVELARSAAGILRLKLTPLGERTLSPEPAG
jgi:hypothetical protein